MLLNTPPNREFSSPTVLMLRNSGVAFRICAETWKVRRIWWAEEVAGGVCDGHFRKAGWSKLRIHLRWLVGRVTLGNRGATVGHKNKQHSWTLTFNIAQQQESAELLENSRLSVKRKFHDSRIVMSIHMNNKSCRLKWQKKQAKQQDKTLNLNAKLL